MKTILYNPIFINPQAYYVFPRLTRYLQPDNESTAEPANYIGTIEVKVIAYGDTTLKRTYTNTDSIDLSEFKNTWIRISLFTKVGSCVLGEWKIGNMESDLPYIDPEVLASLKAVVIVGNKTNNDSDRAIVKNLVDPDNPFVISNAAFKLNSGFGEYKEDFTSWRIYPNIKVTDNVITTNGNFNSTWFIYKHSSESKINEMNIKVSGIPKGGKILYFYISDETANLPIVYTIPKDGIYHLPESKINNNRASVGFTVESSYDWNNIRIEQIPSFEGAFVTDGINDLITSTKTVQEMGITDEVTVVSMIHQIDLNSTYTIATTNYIENSNSREHVRSDVYNYGKTGIYGYSASLINNTKSDIKNILGDEADYYVKSTNSLQTIFDAKFSVVGRISELTEASQVAWYWTIIANKVLTTDQINQVIAYFNLDRTLNPDILCNTIKQGITNENHAEFGDKLIDFSGNGRDIQLNNIAWNKESGIDDDSALRLDGVNDFGKVTGMPIYKDYTVVADYERLKIGYIEDKGTPAILSKSYTAGQGAFLMNLIGSTGEHMNAYTFGNANSAIFNDLSKKIYYQSKYKMQGFDMTIGSGVDGDSLWLGVVRDNDSRFFNGAIYSLMSFPYSMSKFLIERQLKKHKLGTLYPDMVEFRPIVKSNNKWDIIEIQQGDKSLYRPTVNDDKTGIYLKKDSTIGIYVKPKDADEVTKIVVNGTEYTNLKINSNGFYYVTLPITKSPQKINITIDEYIRYEDIVQPYPSFVKLENLDRTYTYTWGDKLKVGDTIRYNSSVNLLEGAYTLKGQLECNGVYVYDNNQHITVAKEMIFAWTNNPVWSIDNNEPKCILSPRLLRIPNSSYKILGHIPDISGHGNHGKINNSAYAEGSGVNEDGSYQFDGVDDFITIPTTVGGKQVLMKVNWQSIAGTAILYDQRTNGGFAIFNRDFDTNENKVPAYRARNIGGSTYIDGILNEYIYASELKDITHNIVELCDPELNTGTLNPKIGSSYLNSNYTQMSLYDFMLFDEISTDDKIQELNKYVGIEAKVELPPYYWDTYGKTNSDADRDTIQQRGVAVGDYDLINYNHAYEGMSGYNGYPVVFGESKTWEAQGTKDGDKYYIYTSNANKFNITQIKISSSLFYTYIKRNGELTSGNKDIPSFNLKVTGLDYDKFYLAYYYLKSADVEVRNVINITSDGIYELPKSFANDGSLTETNSYIGLSFIRKSSEIPDIIQNVNVTIEVLPEYENGLVYDGIEDYSVNTNIPALTDYTYICKRTILNIPSNGATLLKGAHKANGGAFIADYSNKWQFNFGQYNIIQSIPDGINWQTSSSFNGTSINRGTNTDDKGITIGRFSNGYANIVLYKLILYPKTIPLLQINFLKNLMERDEIIDLNNPIFIQE